MKKLVVYTIGSVILLSASTASAIDQVQRDRKPTPSKASSSQKQKGIPKSVILEEADIAERALYAESRRLAKEARSLFRDGNLRAAEETCLRAIDAAPAIDGAKRLPITLRPLLGDVYQRQGRYEEALRQYLPSSQDTWRIEGFNLDVALCYLRLGNVKMARQFYSDQIVLNYLPEKQRDEYRRWMPGTKTDRDLEASILYARGNEYAMSGRNSEALADFKAASVLAPTNGLIAYGAGMSLVHMNRRAEALPFFRVAAEHGQGEFAKDAKQYLSNAREVRTAP